MADQDLTARLQDMIGDLQGYIERRAGELAAPLIAEAGVAAGQEVADARAKQRRAEDLVAELRRQLATADRHRERQRATIERVRMLAKLTDRPDTYDQAVLDCQAMVACTWDEAHWRVAMSQVKAALVEMEPVRRA